MGKKEVKERGGQKKKKIGGKERGGRKEER